ncbi:MAG: hypothetical protein JJU19_03995 [Pararhodobacter sp.]|nr:hypothetical protein [Pararhodobacter sp.]
MSILDTLPEALRAELQAMTPEQICDIAADVRIDQMRAEQAKFPTDPKEGLEGLRSVVLRRDYRETIDDPVSHAMNALLMLRLACNHGNSLDGIDLDAMVYSIDSAYAALKDHDWQMREIATRLRQMTHPLKK